MNDTPLYAVFGNPIAHSKSPQIHQMFAAQEGVSVRYERRLSQPDAFARDIAAFFAGGGAGANVTLPFKIQAAELAHETSPRARAAGAANTLIRLSDGLILADNTDGIGLVSDITQNLGFPLAGKRILILGAGGAVRGVLQPLLDENPAEIVIANRTHEKAQALARQFGIAAEQTDRLKNGFDLIVNGTSGSLGGQVPAVPAAVYAGCALAYDMAYGDTATAFQTAAALAGAAHTAGGLGMLVCQAAASYRLWRGFAPDTAPVVAALGKAV
ncbi:Shikimate dehydrogenase [Kingella potus]|uniref:Shikimate dehydrogenase (NADP(+)) n=1 Tax=Kingella potus TaxID=265175 RepID=A0A377QZA7_9NEIS|nr:shikimate dehydrogenase [Kingella potus]UOP01063.1 shikimate dehydrogenase [Kingella potus]STR00744.1 Shikimate dehydrogenase [Kingella potus]